MDVMYKNAETSVRQAHNISQTQCLTLMQGVLFVVSWRESLSIAPMNRIN